MKKLFICILFLVLSACVYTKEKQADIYGDQLGTVQNTQFCSEKANHQIERGIALIHHMTYRGARAAFIEASKLDPECPMAYWGHAMSYIHPLWSDPPSEDEFRKGNDLLETAKTKVINNEKMQAYIFAAEAYYSQGRNINESSNLERFARAWEKVYRQFPEDMEAASFYSLALMSTADPSDKTLSVQKKAGAIAEMVFNEIPDHPGAHHYIIHAYDYPSLAEKALKAARNYGNIAPDIPHALHMPTHIFTRLGLWEESIDMNIRSASAALKHPAGDQLSMHYLHALDYLIYAYLQRGEDKKAREVLEVVKDLKGPFQPHVASAYTLAAIPARIMLERQQWTDTILLKPRIPENYPWDRYPSMEAITNFARALGAARSGDTKTASQELATLVTLREKAGKTSSYWAKQIEIMRLSAKAWLIYEQGKGKEGLAIMRNATEMEASTEKHPVTPGEILPARELYADMLIEEGYFEDALTEYETALKRLPNRFNCLYGAGRAAELGGDKNKAAFYYKALIEVTADTPVERDKLHQARIFMAEN